MKDKIFKLKKRFDTVLYFQHLTIRKTTYSSGTSPTVKNVKTAPGIRGFPGTTGKIDVKSHNDKK